MSWFVLWCSVIFFSLVFLAETQSQLILSPYLKNNDVKTARQLSKVTPDLGNVTSYSGFFTVNKTCGNNLFFWFFPARKNWLTSPVIVWLQGGPGSSSMFGLFELCGPWSSFPDVGLVPRNHSWNNFSNLLFIDNPVGAGFSYTKKDCYPETIAQVVKELYSAIVQFFKLFPELKKNPFYITGESFAGHYNPALALLIHSKNKKNCTSKINLKGIVVGNPEIQLTCHDLASFLYQLGIVDEELRDEMYEAQRQLKKSADAGNYTEAFEHWKYIINVLYTNRTEMKSYESIQNLGPDVNNYDELMRSSKQIRKQIKVGNAVYNDVNDVTYTHLIKTVAQPVTSDVQKLLQLNKYIVVFYSGQFDVICLYRSTICVIRRLKWGGQKEYLNAKRKIWHMNGEIVGWYKTASAASNKTWLGEVLIMSAQHSVPLDKPECTYKMMKAIVETPPGEDPLGHL